MAPQTLATTDLERALPRVDATRLSTAEHVAEAIRDLLLDGTIKPGARLSDQTIASAMGASRNTIREALTILASQGLVVRRLHHGAVVAELSLDELADVYQARRVLEAAGLRAGMRSGDAWVDDLRNSLKSMQDAISRDDLQALLDADTAFHRVLVAPLGSTRIAQLYRNVQTELRLTRAWYGEREEHPQFLRRHKRILTAVEAKDSDRAESLVVELIDAGETRLRSQLPGRTTANSPR